MTGNIIRVGRDESIAWSGQGWYQRYRTVDGEIVWVRYHGDDHAHIDGGDFRFFGSPTYWVN